MRRFFARRRILIGVIVALIIIAQLGIFKPVRDTARKIVAWPIHYLGATSTKLGTAIRLLGSIDDLSKENSGLKIQNTELTAQLAQLEAVQGENTKLKEDLNFQKTRSDLQLIPAQIISFSPDSGYQIFTIDKGQKDGLSLEQAVVSSGFLIGKIKKISDHTAEVWQLTNRNLLTPVTLAKSQVTGILKGGVSGLVVENIPVDAAIEKGEAVVTSSLEGLYPAGIAVGTVEDISSKKEEIFLTIRVTSPINVRNLGTVFVAKPR